MSRLSHPEGVRILHLSQNKSNLKNMKAKKQELFQDCTTENSKLSRFEKKLVPFARDCSIHLDPAPWVSKGENSMRETKAFGIMLCDDVSSHRH